MKKILLGLVLGLILGGAVMRWLPRSPAPEAAAPKEKDAAEEKGAGLHLTKEQIAHAGLTLATSTEAALAPETRGYGRVLDPTSLVTVAAEIATAKAALALSEKELARVETLHAQDQNASGQALEQATAARLRDRITLDAARARLVLAWGPALAKRSELAALVHAMVNGEAALVRIDLPPGEAPATAPATARVGALGAGGALIEVEVLGAAPTADAQTQGVSYLALWRTAPLPPGATLRAAVPTGAAAQAALLVPRSALVQHDGSIFVYVQTGELTFARRLVEVGRDEAAGVAVTAGLEAKDKIVTVGAQQLLSTELQAAGGGEH